MCDVGDVLFFYSYVSDKPKNHLCLIKPTDTEVGWFLLLNSEYRSADSLGIACARIPELPPTKSGLSYICCECFPCRKAHFLTHSPQKVCDLATDICQELLEFIRHNRTLERKHRNRAVVALEAIIRGRQSSD